MTDLAPFIESGEKDLAWAVGVVRKRRRVTAPKKTRKKKKKPK